MNVKQVATFPVKRAVNAGASAGIVAQGAVKTAAIVVRALDNELPICLAAERLQSYLKKLFGFQVTIHKRDVIADLTFRLGCERDHTLSEQGYSVRSIGGNESGNYELTGGSSAALAWAVSELAEFWGVRFLTYRDVFPDMTGIFRMPEKPIVREPILKYRGVRIYNDWPNDPCRWPVSDVEVLIDQLSKMRINAVGMFVRPYDPFYSIEWRGARKDLALTNYGFKLPVDEQTIGYEHFQASGDAARGQFSNPDLDHEETFDRTIAAGTRFLSRIRRATRDRGMHLSAVIAFSDFPEPIKRRLVEVSKEAHIPETASGRLTRIRYERWTEGPTRAMAQVMSIRNPHYLDLLQVNLRAHLDALSEFDEIYLWPSEFRGSEGDAEYAWQDMDRRYRLSEIATLDSLIQEARERAEISADRAEHELRSDVSALWIFDFLLGLRSADKRDRLPKICPAGLNPSLQKLLPRVFGTDVSYLGTTGYMPTTINRHIDSFSHFQSNTMKATVFTTLEDDNIGPVPQESTPSVATLTQMLYQNRLDGYLTRQWNYSKVLPSLHYLTHASWDRGFTQDESIEHLFSPICGERAMPALRIAIEVLRKNTSDLQRKIICPAFLSPHLILGRWTSDSAAYFGSASNLDRDQVILEQYERAAELIVEAVTNSLQAGKVLLMKMQKQAEFACAWLRGLMALATAVELRNKSKQADAARDVDLFDQHQLATRDYLDIAVRHMREATERWAEAVEDRADLGTLAALNEYGVKTIESIRHLAHLDAIHWSRNC